MRVRLIVVLSLVIVIVITMLQCDVFHIKQIQHNAKAMTEIEGTTMDNTDNSTNTETKFIVCIETGHGIDSEGKWDTGCSWNGYDEAELMIPIAKSMVKQLEKNGIECYTDANTDNNRNLFAVLDYIETHHMDAFINIHCDCPEAVSGTMPLYYTEEQKKLGECLNKAVHEKIDIPDRGLQWRNDLDTLCSSQVKCVSCLFETGCIESDFSILKNQANEYGKALAKGLCDYLGVQYVE